LAARAELFGHRIRNASTTVKNTDISITRQHQKTKHGKSKMSTKLTIAFLATTAFLPIASYAASTEEILYNFPGGLKNCNPAGDLIEDSTGNLYGMTTDQYSSDYNLAGEVFKLSPPARGKIWLRTLIYQFKGHKGNTAFPGPGLAMDAKGNIYGTIGLDGETPAYLFELKPPSGGTALWAEAELGTLPGDAQGSLLLLPNGTIYLATSGGGATNDGTVVQATPPVGTETMWTIATIYQFPGSADGITPQSGVIRNAAGDIYGTTSLGGTHNLGEVFQLIPPAKGQTAWSSSILYSFEGGTTDGANPVGVTLGGGGELFGATSSGGSSGSGTVFELLPPSAGQSDWAEAVLYSFTGVHERDPNSPPITSGQGILYGTAGGVLYSLSPPATEGSAWSESVLHTFSGPPDGSIPVAPPLKGENGLLYGTTLYGGTGMAKNGSSGCGIVYQETR
jgi:uncharacterized repeat protein (TIGR03803 family)